MDTQNIRQVIEHLNTEHGYNLTNEEKDDYTNSIGKYINQGAEYIHIQAVVNNYIQEHKFVELLKNNDNEAWSIMLENIRRIVQSKSGIENPQDETQSISLEVIRSLPNYTYHSKLLTWIYAIVTYSRTRALRQALAQKRRSDTLYIDPSEPSLESLLYQNQETTYEKVDYKLLLETINNTLADQKDERLLKIAKYWLIDGMTLREIGSQLHLSVTRVHMLLEQARQLLRSNPELQNWLSDLDPCG